MSGEVQLRERLSKDPAAILVEHISKPKFQIEFAHLFDHQMAIHLAHCLMLIDQGIISREDGQAILTSLLELHGAGVQALKPNYALEDLYSHIEHRLITQLGPEIGGRLHTARSRNDLGVTQWRMVLRGHLLDVRTSLNRFRGVLLDLAEQYAETVMPGYTHSQHAQPITLGYYFQAFADVLARDAGRLHHAWVTNNCNPLGAAALTTTGFPIDRAATSRRLGFDSLVRNGFDAVASRDDAEEAACALAQLGVHLSRLAEDCFVWCTTEFGFLEFGDDYSSVSSIMPQKKNPGILEYTKKRGGHLIGTATQVLAAVKGSWFTDANDATDAGNEPLISATKQAAGLLDVLAGAFGTITVRSARMLDLARTGFGTMTELADTIVRESGVSFRVAHNIVGKTVAVAIERGLTADQITHAMLDATAQELFGRPLGVDQAAIPEALDPAGNIRLRTVEGGPAPRMLGQMIADARAQLQRDADELAAATGRVNGSRDELFAEARQIVAQR